jgi:ankyrin repeat protein
MGCLSADAAELEAAADRVLCAAETFFARKGDPVGRLKKLLDGARFYAIDHHSAVWHEAAPLLNLAAYHGCRKCAAELGRRGARVSLADKGGFTPLMNAAWSGDLPMARLLLGLGAARDNVGAGHMSGPIGPEAFSAEQWARRRGHAKVADLIRDWTTLEDL